MLVCLLLEVFMSQGRVRQAIVEAQRKVYATLRACLGSSQRNAQRTEEPTDLDLDLDLDLDGVEEGAGPARHGAAARATAAAVAAEVEEVVDMDVVREAERVRADGSRDVVVLDRLRKEFAGGKVAVKGLSFGVNGGVFGFLGINGAGKTTTLSILTGQLSQTSGTATICGHDTCTEQSTIRKRVGFCPQVGPLHV